MAKVGQPTRPLLIPPSFVRPIIITTTNAVNDLMRVTVRRCNNNALLSTYQATVSYRVVHVRVEVLLYHDLSPRLAI